MNTRMRLALQRQIGAGGKFLVLFLALADAGHLSQFGLGCNSHLISQAKIMTIKRKKQAGRNGIGFRRNGTPPEKALALVLSTAKVYNDPGVRKMVRELYALSLRGLKAFAEALKIPGECSGRTRTEAFVGAALFSTLCAVTIVEVLLFAVVLLVRNHYDVLTHAQFAIGTVTMTVLLVFGRLFRAEAHRAWAQRPSS